MFVRKSTYERYIAEHEDACDALYRRTYKAEAKVFILKNALQKIISENTDKPNATVQRMVRIAEDALTELDRVKM